MRNLYQRLKQQREASPALPAAGAAAAARAVAQPSADLAGEWQPVAQQVWRAVYRSPLLGSDALYRSAAHGGLLLGPEIDPHGLCFFDSETTGLSGGAGTTVFLLACARLHGAELETTLLFLSDFSGEASFLHLVRDQLMSAQTLVSYNGRAFDSNILRNRFLLNRIDPPHRPHIDLLHPARRLFGSLLERCSLAVVERDVLGVTRDIDIDGALIPDVWLRFLRSGRTGELQSVFAHVRQDVVSLVALLAKIEELVASPDRGGIDPLQRARLLVESPYRRAGSVRLRRSGLQSLSVLARDPSDPRSAIAARYYCALLKRCGNWDVAVPIWRDHFERRRSVWAAIELAKFYEHRCRDYAAAAETVAHAAGWDHASAMQPELTRRLERLDGKQRRASGSSAVRGHSDSA
ncbi:MAG: hypothetical protein EA404_11455 [Spirochaetaceae bacterium]|nr:MAG: hypothetical protein EA404_11455 [Spirochaetaceae bacterium]